MDVLAAIDSATSRMFGAGLYTAHDDLINARKDIAELIWAAKDRIEAGCDGCEDETQRAADIRLTRALAAVTAHPNDAEGRE